MKSDFNVGAGDSSPSCSSLAPTFIELALATAISQLRRCILYVIFRRDNIYDKAFKRGLAPAPAPDSYWLWALQQMEPCSDPSDSRDTADPGAKSTLAKPEPQQRAQRRPGPAPAAQASHRKRLRPAPSAAPAAGPAGTGRGGLGPSAGRAPSAPGAAPPPRPLIGCGPGGGARGSCLAPLSGAFGASAMAESGVRDPDGETRGGGVAGAPVLVLVLLPVPVPRRRWRFAVRRGATGQQRWRWRRARAHRARERACAAVGRSVVGAGANSAARGSRVPLGGSAGPRPRCPSGGTAPGGRGTGGSAGGRARSARPRPAGQPRGLGRLSPVAYQPRGQRRARVAPAGAGTRLSQRSALPEAPACSKGGALTEINAPRAVCAVLPRGAAGSANAPLSPALSNADPAFPQPRCRGAAPVAG